MNWETVELSKPTRKTEAFASVGRNAISLSGGACSLLADYPKYSFVQILRGTKNGKKVLGIRLLTQDEKNCLKLKKRKANNEIVAFSGIIYNKPIMEELFGIVGVQNKVTTYPVSLDEDEKNILIIHIEE